MKSASLVLSTRIFGIEPLKRDGKKRASLVRDAKGWKFCDLKEGDLIFFFILNFKFLSVSSMDARGVYYMICQLMPVHVVYNSQCSSFLTVQYSKEREVGKWI